MKNCEKTIPFLRRLIDMLEDEGTAISFSPGVHKKSLPGRIVVHDRAQVESEVLPRYFNHSSFASLRRQLNYFEFKREGKGKQKGATYINDQVFDLDDILHLKRRLPGATAPSPPLAPKSAVENEPIEEETKFNDEKTAGVLKKASARLIRNSGKRSAQTQTRRHSKKVRKILECSVPVVHLPTKKTRPYSPHNTSSNTVTPAPTISPPPGSPDQNSFTTLLDLTRPEFDRSSSSNSSTMLDLTKPECEESSTASASSGNSSVSGRDNSLFYPRPMAVTQNVWFNIPTMPKYQDIQKEEDILAGCSALLSLGWQK
mmetsp:Transcript_5708/g.8649  ORF Transcript_5708/g.8649 Transcript_5708/m.8649 type:complete len:315 (-) Transcript_5708:154-1098(-)